MDLDKLRENIEAGHAAIHELCSGKRRWTMSIPAEPDRDQDLVLTRALEAGTQAIDRLQRVETALRQLINDHLDTCDDTCEAAEIARAALEGGSE